VSAFIISVYVGSWFSIVELYIFFKLSINATFPVQVSSDIVAQLSTTIFAGANSNHPVIVYHRFLYESGRFW
jgi:hypothetical protein